MPSYKLCPLLHIVGTDQGDTTPLSKNAIFTISLNTLRWSGLLKNRLLSFSTESSTNAPRKACQHQTFLLLAWKVHHD